MKRTISYRMLEALRQGKDRLGREALERVIAFVESQRMPDESFRNKSGHSDLYYTMFGWTLSYVLGIRQEVRKMHLYLDSLPETEMDLIHRAAWMRCRLICRLQAKTWLPLFFRKESHKDLNPERTDYYPNNDPNAPYSCFIRLCMQEDGKGRIDEKEMILHTLSRYRISGGGYANKEGALSATTNATVAALAVRGQLAGYDMNDDVTYLWGMQDSSGGFLATDGSPMPDLLSTATALFMLRCYRMTPFYAAGDIIDAHWLDNGGFAATLLDEVSDVEYTFYGLLALGTCQVM